MKISVLCNTTTQSKAWFVCLILESGMYSIYIETSLYWKKMSMVEVMESRFICGSQGRKFPKNDISVQCNVITNPLWSCLNTHHGRRSGSFFPLILKCPVVFDSVVTRLNSVAISSWPVPTNPRILCMVLANPGLAGQKSPDGIPCAGTSTTHSSISLVLCEGNPPVTG